MYELLFINANIITMDPALKRAAWVAVKDGRIAAIGKETPPIHLSKKTIDLEGKTMLPGLIDSHAHGTTTGFSLNAANVAAAACIDDILEATKEKCAELDAKNDTAGWVFVTGMNLFTLREQRAPSRWELDDVSGEHPVVVVYVTMHGVAANTKAMNYINIPDTMPGVEINEKGEKTGSYTSDESSFLAISRALGNLDDNTIEKYIRDCAAFAASRGVTTLHSLDGMFVAEDRDFFIWMNIKDSLPIHVVNYFQSTNVNLAKALKLPRLGGCLTLDGTGFEHTMALEEPYEDDVSTNGVLYWSDEDVYEFVSAVHRAGMQCATHCLGDRAIEQLLSTYERVIKEQGTPNNIRHRIEHFAMCRPDQIKRAVDLGIVFPMQPVFTWYWDNPDIEGGHTYKDIFGEERGNAIDPFPAIIEAGGIICGGSDSAVTEINPLIGIHAAANAPNPVRKVSLDDAIRMFTINGAWAAGEENKKGTIEIGKLADFTVVDKDPYEEQQHIKDFVVEMTIVEGKAVYVRTDD